VKVVQHVEAVRLDVEHLHVGQVGAAAHQIVAGEGGSGDAPTHIRLQPIGRHDAQREVGWLHHVQQGLCLAVGHVHVLGTHRRATKVEGAHNTGSVRSGHRLVGGGPLVLLVGHRDGEKAAGRVRAQRVGQRGAAGYIHTVSRSQLERLQYRELYGGHRHVVIATLNQTYSQQRLARVEAANQHQTALDTTLLHLEQRLGHLDVGIAKRNKLEHIGGVAPLAR